MSKHLNHHDWVAEQFKPKYLKISYRNVFVHSSIIEGMLINESGMVTFDSANKFLLCSRKINSLEFCVFNEIRKIRNKLAHKIFEKKGLSQDEIGVLLQDLTEKIHEAYRISILLNEKLFKKYKLERPSNITFSPRH